MGYYILTLQHVLQRLNLSGGTGSQPNTILGDIFHHAEKASTLLQSIASLGLISTGKDKDTDGSYDNVPLTGTRE